MRFLLFDPIPLRTVSEMTLIPTTTHIITVLVF
jgi:hypothetical protein